MKDETNLLIAEILRVYLPTETLGSWWFQGVLLCKTMELPNKDNQHNISCIPEGTYVVVKEAYTDKHPYPHFRVLDVPDRNGILCHKITFVKDLLGCIGIGSAFSDLNGDNVPDMQGSSIGLNRLYAAMPDKFLLKISEKPKTV